MEVSLQEILDAREARAQRQDRLLAEYGGVLICFTMNIAGPVKDSPLIRAGFRLGQQALRQQLPIRQEEEVLADTGCEYYCTVDADAEAVKQKTAYLEDHNPAGRLYDMDVLTRDGKVSREQLGLAPRKCLLCERDARICGRSRTHSIPQLQAETARLLRQAVSRHIGDLAEESLRREVLTTPKPGLVDQNNCGSHSDMDLPLFLESARALRPYFASCARIGMETAELAPAETFDRLRREGLAAEQVMYAATGGVNTHKGAVFTLGLLCGAAGRTLCGEPEAVLSEVKAMAAGLTARDFFGVTAENATTAGQRLFAQHGITGVRGQAEQGYPVLLQVGLPVLEQGLCRGLSRNDAGCAALLHILAATEDTNMIARSDADAATAVRAQIGRILADTPYPGVDILLQLDREFAAQNLSPGGSADLLAATYFLYSLRH